MEQKEKIKVVKWISFDESEGMPAAIGGLGGWFDNGHRWKDYLEQYNDLGQQYAEALRKEVLRLQIKHDGSWHESAEDGVPVFSDGYVATFSHRAWGDLLGAIWSEEEGKDYHYTHFAYYSEFPEETPEEVEQSLRNLQMNIALIQQNNHDALTQEGIDHVYQGQFYPGSPPKTNLYLYPISY